MTGQGTGYMPLNRQLFDRSMGEAVAELAKQRYSTASTLAKAWDIDLTTAENVRKGHIGVRALFAAIRSEGWEFLKPLGEEVTGESLHQYEERKLESIIRDAENARQNLVRLRSRREALEQRAAGLDDVLRGQGAVENG